MSALAVRTASSRVLTSRLRLTDDERKEIASLTPRLRLADDERKVIASMRLGWKDRLLEAGPVDREYVERLLRERSALYEVFGFRHPPPVEWCDGPLELAQRVLAGGRPTGVLSESGFSLWERVWRLQLANSMVRRAGLEIFHSFNDPLVQRISETVFSEIVLAERGEGSWHALKDRTWPDEDGSAARQTPELGWRISWCPYWRYLAEQREHVQLRALELLIAFAAVVPLWVMRGGTAFLCDRPLVCLRDEEGRLHGVDEPAVLFADGVRIHARHGIAVRAPMVGRPTKVSHDGSPLSPEFRRMLLERYGGRYLRDCGDMPIAEDEHGRLWRFASTDTHSLSGWEPTVVLEVENSTPEADGSRRHYFLRVPPEVESAHEAAAWTFALDADGYRPDVAT